MSKLIFVSLALILGNGSPCYFRGFLSPGGVRVPGTPLDLPMQAVVLEGETSTSVLVTSGVPQGTVLGPILFLLYINDLPECISNSTVQLFADDCILYRQIDSTADCVKLQDELNALQHWEDMWLMTFNAKNATPCRYLHHPSPYLLITLSIIQCWKMSPIQNT